MSRKIAFLGPAGTFTEAALRKTPEAESASTEPAGSVISALNLVRDGSCTGAVVPIENSVEGGVSATLDEITVDNDLQIMREILVPISFVLVGRPDAGLSTDRLDEVTTVSTHTHAWAQVRGWAEKNIPGAEFLPAASTASGARDLLDPQTTHQTAVCAPHLAEELGLPVLAEKIEDMPDAVTRFIYVTKRGKLPEPTGSDKSTAVIPLPEDHPGALMDILSQFATRGINLSRIESRPTGAGLGRYFFSIDMEGHLADQRVSAAMAALYRMFPGVQFLGSYPRAIHREYQVPESFSDDAYQAGKDWVAGLLEH